MENILKNGDTMTTILHKELDSQGRIILPKKWRNGLKNNKLIIIIEDSIVKILPETKKLSTFYEKAKPSTLSPDPFQNYEQSIAEASHE